MNQNELLLHYAKLGIYIGIYPDAFKFNHNPEEPPEEQVAWRICIDYWYKGEKWFSDDIGCDSDLGLMLRHAEREAQHIFEMEYKNTPLDFKTVVPFIPPRPKK